VHDSGCCCGGGSACSCCSSLGCVSSEEGKMKKGLRFDKYILNPLECTIFGSSVLRYGNKKIRPPCLPPKHTP
jgi:hypothetical protein